MALWNLLGQRGVEMLAWESFGLGWVTDVEKQLKLDDVTTRTADYGDLPDLDKQEQVKVPKDRHLSHHHKLGISPLMSPGMTSM